MPVFRGDAVRSMRLCVVNGCTVKDSLSAYPPRHYPTFPVPVGNAVQVTKNVTTALCGLPTHNSTAAVVIVMGIFTSLAALAVFTGLGQNI